VKTKSSVQAIRHTGRTGLHPGIWIAPLIILIILIILFSLRLLSDPDLGFHLNSGRWIISHQSIPQTDIATYTVPDHTYIDLHWLFQVMIYCLYLVIGYKGLSLLVCLLVCLLFFLIGRRMIAMGVSWPILIPLLLITLVIMEPRFLLRPELVTYLFITISLIILDGYYDTRKNKLYLLPVILLLWCNMQGLYMLGFSLSGAYFISLWIRDKRPDLRVFGWGLVSVLICLINPYGWRGFLFPFELLTRFSEGNIFHAYIKEFQPWYKLETWTLKEYCFLIYLILSSISILATIRQRKIHDLILWLLFCILALLAIRNIPLFLLISLPVTGRSLDELFRRYNQWFSGKIRKRISTISAGVVWLVMLAFIPRLITDNYYASNLSYDKTGIGLDRLEHPEGAANFLINHHLDGRIMNSLSYGGWLSWRLSRTVFIDARLEVIRESLYTEVVRSWDGGLGGLIEKYQPDMLVYDYARYFSWTPQLLSLPGWHPIYLDGQSVVFARKGYAEQISFPDTTRLFDLYNLRSAWKLSDKQTLLTREIPSAFTVWLWGFYKTNEWKVARLQNIASLFLQMQQYQLAERFFLETLQESCCSRFSCYFALADIYMQLRELSLARQCYLRILEVDPENEPARKSLAILMEKPLKNMKGMVKCLNDAEATVHFNKGNTKYKAGDINGALDEYTTAIDLNPGYSKAFNNRGYIRAVELQEYQAAICDFDTAITLDPGFADAYLGRGSSRYSLHDIAGALKDWEKAKSLGNHQAEELLRQHKR